MKADVTSAAAERRWSGVVMDDRLPETLPCISHETRSRWLVQRMEILKRNPNFASAALEYARGAVKIFEGQYIANKVMANLARRVICMAILALHFDQSDGNSGAIITSIQHITTVLGLCSRSTTAATIDLLEKVGLVTRIQGESDHRQHLIRPSDKLVIGIKSMVAVAVSSADRLFPSRHYSDLLSGSDDFTERYFASSLHSLLSVGRLDSELSGSRLFTASDSGGVLLCKLMSIRGGTDENVVSFPFDEIGHLYGVSRTHIRRLMTRAELEGLVRLIEPGGRKIEILPALDDIFDNVVAIHVAKAQFDIHLANGDYDLLPIDRCD